MGEDLLDDLIGEVDVSVGFTGLVSDKAVSERKGRVYAEMFAVPSQSNYQHCSRFL